MLQMMPVIGGFLQEEFCAVKWLRDDRNAAMRAVRTRLLPRGAKMKTGNFASLPEGNSQQIPNQLRTFQISRRQLC